MAVSIAYFTLERSTDRINWTQIEPSLDASLREYTDTTQPLPTLYYRLTGITDDDEQIPYNIVRIDGNSSGFVKRFGTTGVSIGIRCIKTPDGGILIAGQFSGTIDFSGGTQSAMNSAGSYDIFLAKFSRGGTFVWQSQYGGAAADVILGLAINSSGEIAISGLLNGGIVAKFNSTGVLQWTSGPDPATFTTAIYIAPRCVAIDSSGNVISAGNFRATFASQIDFGNGITKYTYPTAIEPYMAVYDTSGGCVRVDQYNSLGGDHSIEAIELSENNSIYVTGYSNGGGLTIGATINPYGSAASWIAKHASNGSVTWGRFFGHILAAGYGGTARAYALALAGTGNIIVGGYHAVTVATFDTEMGGEPGDAPNSILSLAPDIQGGVSAFWASYSMANGAFNWVKGGSGGSKHLVHYIATNLTGEIVTVGLFRGTVNFGGQSLVSSSLADTGYVARYDPSGNLRWAKPLPVAQYTTTSFNGAAMDNDGNSYVIGSFAGTISFQGIPMSAIGSLDVIFSSLNQNGN